MLLPTGLQEIGDSAGARVASMRAVPNPFSSSSAIHYSLIHRTQATLEIYNLTGELVRTLVAEVKPPGAHMVTWDTNDDLGRKVPSGVYLVRLRAGDLASTHKLVLMR